MHLIPATPEEVGDGEDRLVDVHNPVVPQSIRTRVLAMAQPGDQVRQRQLAGLGLAAEHAFAEKGAAQRHAVEPADQLAVDARLHAVRVPAFVQRSVKRADVWIDPGVFAIDVWLGAEIDHGFEVAINSEAEAVLAHGAQKPARHGERRQGQNGAPIGIDDEEAVLVAAFRHRKDPAPVAGQQVVGREYLHARPACQRRCAASSRRAAGA